MPTEQLQRDTPGWIYKVWYCAPVLIALLGPASLLNAPYIGAQTNSTENNTKEQNLKWTPPNVDARLKSLATTPPCDLATVIGNTSGSSLVLDSNLEKFTAREFIDYRRLDNNGFPTDSNSGSFDYVYWVQHQWGGTVSRESRYPVKGSAAFRESRQDVGLASLGLIFLPDLLTDYEMKCEGLENREGQSFWVIHFQHRKDRPSRTLELTDGYRGKIKGRAWISREDFQVNHLEAKLMGDVPSLRLQELAVSVDYTFVQRPSKNPGVWLPKRIVAYWTFDTYRLIIAHTFSDYQFFEIQTEEKIQQPKVP
jgi:hypothetical protein